MKFTKLALTCLCSTLIFCGCTKSSNVVLKINDKEYTRAEFYEDFNKIKKIQLKNAPKEMQKDDSYIVLSIKDKYTNDFIVKELLTAEFDKRNIQAEDKEIEAKKAQIAAQLGSEETLKKLLKENNISDEKLKSDLSNEVKMEKLINKIGTSNEISDKEAKKYYDSNKIKFEIPQRVKVSHILIDTNEDNIRKSITDNEKKLKLSSSDIDKKVKEEVAKNEKLIADIQKQAANNPKMFAQLAKQYSQDTATAQKGGDLGYIMEGQMVPEFSKAAFSSKVGVVGPVVKTQFGSHVILVTDKAKAGIQSYNTVKNDLKTYLVQQKKLEAIQKLVEGLKNQAKIEYVDESLKPEVLKKQLNEALTKQIEAQQKANAPKSKQKAIEEVK